MAWTAPRTWVAGEVVTAALFNAHIRDNFLAMGGQPVLAKVQKATGTQTLTTGVAAQVTYNSEIYDDFAMFGVNSTHFNVPTGETGMYLCCVTVGYAANATGSRYARVRHNVSGTDIAQSRIQAVADGTATFNTAIGIRRFTGGTDSMDSVAAQSSGGNLDIATQVTEMWMVKVAP